jgi:Ctr copper transporter family
MLAVMSFNVWLFLSVVLGSTSAYAIFSHKEQQQQPMLQLIMPIERVVTLDAQSPTDSIDPERTFSEASGYGADIMDTTAIVHRTDD